MPEWTSISISKTPEDFSLEYGMVSEVALGAQNFECNIFIFVTLSRDQNIRFVFSVFILPSPKLENFSLTRVARPGQAKPLNTLHIQFC